MGKPDPQAGISPADFAKCTVDPGRTESGLTGVNAGVNALLVLANPKVFEQVGVDLPDDKTSRSVRPATTSSPPVER